MFGESSRVRTRDLKYLVVAATLLLCAGCPQYRDASVPNEITRRIAPGTDTPYHLYVPSTYDRKYLWPLVIVCHGTRPWDTPLRQILDWVKLAEEQGFIVAAPELCGTSALPTPPADKQIARQTEDEQRILQTVRQIRGAYNISQDRIFLTGWSAGNFAVLYTGLKNPQVFRALALQQGNFDASFLGDVKNGLDPHQPVCVIHGSSDLLTGKDVRKCMEWLEDNRTHVFELEVSGGHRAHPTVALTFFERVLRGEPWLHIRSFAVEGGDPLAVRFKTRASFDPQEYLWTFGDGHEALVAEPVHHYQEPGTYRVSLAVTTPKGKRVKRFIDLEVPQLHALSARRTTWDESSSR